MSKFKVVKRELEKIQNEYIIDTYAKGGMFSHLSVADLMMTSEAKIRGIYKGNVDLENIVVKFRKEKKKAIDNFVSKYANKLETMGFSSLTDEEIKQVQKFKSTSPVLKRIINKAEEEREYVIDQEQPCLKRKGF